MKSFEITPTKFYSCQICGNDFVSNLEFYIVPGFFPFCSSYKCKFNFLYKLLKKMGFSREELVFLLESIHIKPVFNTENYLELNLTYFELTKYYLKNGVLSNIKGELVQELVQKKLDQKVELGQKLDQPKSLCNKDLVQFEPEPVFSSGREDLNKWF